MKTFFSYSFGCRVNEAEKEEIDRQMIKTGYKFETVKPDIYIINTCSITQKAEREARQLIYQAKKQLPNTKIVITGCAATYWIKNKLFQKLPIDLLVDNVNKEFLVSLISKKLFQKANLNLIASKNETILTNKFIGSGRVIIKIQDGCQRYCSYCIVPYLRGTPKSFKTDYIVEKINQMGKINDIKEVILTAINTEAYGLDIKETLIELIKNIIDKTKIPRISLGSIHPWSINDDFFKFYQDYLSKKRLVDFFHIPLQSGSNKILNLMKRGYTREEFVKKLNTLSKINPFATIATDIIVGFFDEDDSDFADTYNFLEKSPIVKFHIFRYSKRYNTAGFFMAKKFKEPSPKKKSERARALIDLGIKKYSLFLHKNVGRESSVLLLEKRYKGYYEGLLDNQLPILIDIGAKELKSINEDKLIKVKIAEIKNERLFGKVIDYK